MTTGASLLIRADSSPTLGAGHVARCLALAQAWIDDGGRVVVASAVSMPFVDRMLDAEGIGRSHLDVEPGSTADATHTAQLAAASDRVVVDGYSFGADFQAAVAARSERLMTIHDHGQPSRAAADVVLDHGLPADDLGPAPRGAVVLKGCRWLLLRRPFRDLAQRPAAVRHRPRKLLVTSGGGATLDRMTSLLTALRAALDPGLEVRVVLPGGSPAGSAAKTLAPHWEVLGPVPDMWRLMAWADAALAAAGTTVWELLAAGVPTLAVPLVDNQQGPAAELSRLGAVASLPALPADREAGLTSALAGWLDDVDRHAAQVAIGRQLVDGQGAARVARVLRTPACRDHAEPLAIRRARADDARRLWQWANDPEVRSQSFNPEPIPWETHLGWLEDRLTRRDDCALYIGLDELGEPVGQLRVDRVAAGLGESHVAVAAAHRGRGLGARLIRSGTWAGAVELGLETVRARIKPDNRTSVHAFRRAGYGEPTAEESPGSPVVVYWRR